MKNKARQSGARARQHGDPAARGGEALPRRGRWLSKAAVILLAIAVTAAAAFAVFEFVLPGRIPPELVGQWRVVGGDMDGTTFEFQRNGTMIARGTVSGKEGRLEGKAEVTGKLLRTTTVNPLTGREETGTQTIITLTETEFVTDDTRGKRTTMKRVR
jgi:uncharacterized protein (TIGR03066 family)